MKKILLLSLILNIAILGNGQALKIGDQLPKLVFENLLLPNSNNTTLKNISSENLKNKIILIDFWATWCGSCIAVLPKYEILQKKYKKNLQIITVSHESVKRIQSFLKNRPVKLMMAVDTTESLRKYFLYRTIPHIALINTHGIVIAITNSENINDKVIDDVLAGKTISLLEKNDDTKFDFESDYFKVDSGAIESFSIQPNIKGVGTFSKTGRGVFKNRRMSMHNFTIDGLYRMAFKTSYFRQEIELDKTEIDYSNPANTYCVDVIIPKESEQFLYHIMQKKLTEHFEVKAKIEARKTTVYVIKKLNDTILLKPSDLDSDDYSGSSNFFTGVGVNTSILADFLESFGLLGTPIIDETGIKGRYDIHLEWEPEKKGSLKEAFLKVGLILEKTERIIDILVLYK